MQLAGDDEDRYVDVPAVRSWAEDVAPRDGADVTVQEHPGARHAVDLESWPVGESARTALVAFVLREVDR